MARPKQNTNEADAPIINNTSEQNATTPLMKQYYQTKAKYPDAIMLFRVGDFYETFGQDAVITAKVLGIVQTKRNNGGSDVELAGFPYHSLDLYLPRLIRAGYRVAICEQLEKPSPLKKIVRRGVTEVVTPGVTTDDNLLDYKRNNYFAVLFVGKKEAVGVALIDISTGEFLLSEGDWASADKLLQSFAPSEIILPKGKKQEFEERYSDKYYVYTLEDWVFTTDFAREKLLTHFEVKNLKGFGVEELETAQIAAGAALHYLATTEKTNLKHILAITRIHQENYVWLDRFTIRNLELLNSAHESGVPLIAVLDKTVSPMGARLLKKWVLLPLKDIRRIEDRQEIVQYLIDNPELTKEIELFVRSVGDLERLISKVPLGKINPREVRQLRHALEATDTLKTILMTCNNVALTKLAETLNPCRILSESIAKYLVDEPPVQLSKGNVIADDCNKDLDEWRHIIRNSKDLLLGIQQKEAQETGISNLKIGFNNVFGYYLEVTNRFKNIEVPQNWIRKQTLANAERFITPELKELEDKILSAEERIAALEEQLFSALISTIADYIQPVQTNASVIARVDCLFAFAKIAIKNNYFRPQINDSFIIDIKNGRHPVIEQQLPLGESYVPNDVYLDADDQQIMMITGPNMAGKSALLRQTALICLMAQMGCFVPADSANIGIVDKVFTRVGASDNISSGESTFMVEMNETANIMNNISRRSLILLDEIGRGTSTYDGISIAWSIAEYLHDNGIARPKTLFATHYHELNELAEKFPRIRNYNVAVKEISQKVIFLRKLMPGGSQHSFGIHVAKMAGMPQSIVARANVILGQLEEKHIDENHTIKKENSQHQIKEKVKELHRPMQLNIFEAASDPKWEKLKTELQKLDLNALTPIECMLKLGEWKRLVE